MHRYKRCPNCRGQVIRQVMIYHLSRCRIRYPDGKPLETGTHERE